MSAHVDSGCVSRVWGPPGFVRSSQVGGVHNLSWLCRGLGCDHECGADGCLGFRDRIWICAYGCGTPTGLTCHCCLMAWSSAVMTARSLVSLQHSAKSVARGNGLLRWQPIARADQQSATLHNLWPPQEGSGLMPRYSPVVRQSTCCHMSHDKSCQVNHVGSMVHEFTVRSSSLCVGLTNEGQPSQTVCTGVTG